jgi:hypothetical protein
MNKTQIRVLKTHYGCRWSELKHNKKNKQQVLLLENLFFLSNLKPGKTIAYNCLGEIYKSTHNFDVTINDELTYQNLILMNNLEFKYKTPTQLFELIDNYSKAANVKGRICVNLNSAYVLYDRLNYTLNDLVNEFVKSFATKKYVLVKKLTTTKIKNYGYGNIFLILDNHE